MVREIKTITKMIPKKCSSEKDKIDVIIVSVKKDRTELKDLSS